MATPIEQLEAMRQLPENWDGYGAAAPRPDVLAAAVRFLRGVAGKELPEPWVAPTRTGGALIGWEQGAHEVEVEFDTPESGSFVYLNSETGETATRAVA